MVGRLLGPPSYCSEKLVQSAFFLQVHNGSIRQGGAFNIESISKPKKVSQYSLPNKIIFSDSYEGG